MTKNTNTDNGIVLNLPKVDLKTEGSSLLKVGKDELRALILPLAHILKDKEVSVTESSPKRLKEVIANISDTPSFNKLYKEDLASFYLSFKKDMENVAKVARLDSRLTTAWKMIVTSPSINSAEIETMIKRKPVVVTATYWYSSYFCECVFSPLEVTHVIKPYHYYSDNKNDSYTFSISPENRKKMVNLLLGEKELTAESLMELPGKENLLVEDFERHILSDLTFLSGVTMTGSIVSSTGSITAAKLKSLKKATKWAEFQQEGGDEMPDRTELFTNAFCAYEDYGGTPKKKVNLTDTKAFAKFVVDKYPRYITSVKFGAFLPAFKGFTKSWATDSNIGSVTKIVEKLLRPAADGWMSLHNLKLRYLCSPSPSTTYNTFMYLFPSGSRSKHMLKRKIDNLDVYETKSKNIDWFKEVDFPFVVHWIKFLCAAGLVEIASESNLEEVKDDPLEGMRYVRLTPLGRYAYGYDKTYTPQNPEGGYAIEFDDSNGIITVLSDNYPYTLFLQQISVSIGATRFRITPESLMKGCETRNAVVERIDNLSSIIDIDKSPNLKAVVEETKRRIDCLDKMPDDYTILKLKSGLPGLIRLITTDAKIREHTILAEKGVVLVEWSFISTFKKICRNHGYLID